MTRRASTDELIARLAADAPPVKRLLPPLHLAMLWLLSVAALGALGVLLFADPAIYLRRFADPKLMLELCGTGLTGVTAVIAAFHLSRPDRSPAWLAAPLPFLALWIGASGYSCYRHWLRFGPEGWVLGDSSHCFVFILGFSLPLGASLWWLLRRARPLAPVPVAMAGGLGVASCAALLLQFFHPFDVTVMDLAAHLSAVALVVVFGCARPPRLGSG